MTTNSIEIEREQVNLLAEDLYARAFNYKLDSEDPNLKIHLSLLDRFLMQEQRKIFGPYFEDTAQHNSLCASTIPPEQLLEVIYDNTSGQGQRVLTCWWQDRDWFLRLEAYDQPNYHRLNRVEISHFSNSSDPVLFTPPDLYHRESAIPSGVLPTAYGHYV